MTYFKNFEMFLFGSVSVILICFYQTLATNYCTLCQNGSHTLCKYPKGMSQNCINYKKLEFTEELKKYVVAIHNDIRDHIASGKETKGVLGGQPSASNMNVLDWDNEVAEIAQRWADQCVPLNNRNQHDTCRKTGRFDVGQNILTAVTQSDDFPDIGILILNWYKQVEHMIPSDITIFSGSTRGKLMIGQYTQLVWAESKHVGCGAATFSNSSTPGTNEFLHRLVCNYGPRGNLVGSSVYEKGMPCEKCPGKCDIIRKNLCQGDNNNSSAAQTDVQLAPNNITNYVFKNNDAKMLKKLLNSVKIVNPERCINKELISEFKPIFLTYKYSQPSEVLKKITFHIPTQKMELKTLHFYDDLQLAVNNWPTSRDEISLASGAIIKRENGTWKNGKCLCHFVYRSGTTTSYALPVVYFWLILSFFVSYCSW